MAKRPTPRSSDSGKRIRCAIYTRKSTEEGLEQAFNSLDAQREACAAYVLSQQHEGWTLLPELYDDGGFSGGNMERPGLRQLLADVAAGEVDVIVVYKVDRLTRSLADFARIVDVLDGAGASFVSVTQSFNTTTSMGRLTLNVLLSFAQFEREVTGERIRDKVTASKRKGMWMGGVVPLGYDVLERKLVISEAEANTVRLIFARYLALGSIGALAEELATTGVRSKRRVLVDGQVYGERIFSKGALAHLLKNRVYIAEITHKRQGYPGEHEAIVDRGVWDQVQSLIEANRNARRVRARAEHASLLAGMLEDAEGRAMTPSHANKAGRRYRYYVTVSTRPDGKPPQDGWRLPAGDFEQLVRSRLILWLHDKAALVGTFAPLVGQDLLQPLLAGCGVLASATEAKAAADWRQLLLAIDACVQIAERSLSISFCPALLARRIIDSADIRLDNQRCAITVAASLVRRGQELRLAYPPQDRDAPSRRDVKLIGLIAKAEAAHRTLISGAAIEANQRNHLARLARLKFLAPDIVSAILDGGQPVQLSARRLLREASIPLEWPGQRALLGFD